jgi:ribonuclease HII
MGRVIIGVDEAGRGPLAGPVAVGVVLAPAGFDIRTAFPGVNDSKKLSEKKREAIFQQLEERARQTELKYVVLFSSAKIIDERGITYAVKKAVWDGIRKLSPSADGVHVLLDGLLQAPPLYSQETIIRGDESEAIISLASIAAKVTRDRLMKKLSETYPAYGFAEHKGYGTPRHLEAIAAFGLCDIHRRSFCRAGVL